MSAYTKLPELPPIGDMNLYLQVLSHGDLSSSSPSECGDNERLAELGKQLLHYVVTDHLFSKRPLVRAEEIRTFREHHTSPNSLNSWLDSYQLKRKLLVPLDLRDTVCNDLQQMAAFFHCYVAAVYLTKGLPVVQAWITKLIDPDANPPLMTQPLHTQNHFSSTNGASTSGPSKSSSSNVPISLVNETAMRKGLHVNYVASQLGEHHQPTWTVRCLINNVQKGEGVGKTQKIAKEEAAQQALWAMSW